MGRMGVRKKRALQAPGSTVSPSGTLSPGQGDTTHTLLPYPLSRKEGRKEGREGGREGGRKEERKEGRKGGRKEGRKLFLNNNK